MRQAGGRVILPSTLALEVLALARLSWVPVTPEGTHPVAS
jgi:hypothetical protein